MMSMPAFVASEPVLKVAISVEEYDTAPSAEYQQIAHVLAKKGARLQPLRLPTRRARNLFSDKKLDCLIDFSHFSSESDQANGLLLSLPLSTHVFYFFTASDVSPLTSIEDAQGLVIGVPTRYEHYLKPLLTSIRAIEWARSEKQLVEMLKLERIDAILAAFPYMELYRSELSYQEISPFRPATKHLICRQSDYTAKIMKWLL